MTPTDRINQHIQNSRELEKGVQDGPWIKETVPTSCGTCHKVGPHLESGKGLICLYDDYKDGRDTEQCRKADFIASSRTVLPAYREALACAVEALEKLESCVEYEGKVYVKDALNRIAQLLEGKS